MSIPDFDQILRTPRFANRYILTNSPAQSTFSTYLSTHLSPYPSSPTAASTPRSPLPTACTPLSSPPPLQHSLHSSSPTPFSTASPPPPAPVYSPPSCLPSGAGYRGSEVLGTR